MVSRQPFDDPRLRMDSDEVGELLHPKSSQRRREQQQREFLAPVPLAWLCKAAPLPGKALAVGLALWFRAGRTKSKRVRMSWSLLAKFEISPHSGRRGLIALERVELVRIARGQGRCPMVTVLDLTSESGESTEATG
jgi:hypothetical protein